MSDPKVVQKLIEETNGEAFNVRFKKDNGEIRDMLCLTKVSKHLKGGPTTYKGRDGDKPNVGVFEILRDEHGRFKTGSYKCFNAGRVLRIKFAGQTYEF